MMWKVITCLCNCDMYPRICIYIYMYVYTRGPIRARLMRAQGGAHKGPPGPTRARPTSAQEPTTGHGGPQGPSPQGPRGVHKGPGAPQGKRSSFEQLLNRPAHSAVPNKMWSTFWTHLARTHLKRLVRVCGSILSNSQLLA